MFIVVNILTTQARIDGLVTLSMQWPPLTLADSSPDVPLEHCLSCSILAQQQSVIPRVTCSYWRSPRRIYS